VNNHPLIHSKRLFYFSELFKRGSIYVVAKHLNMVPHGIGHQLKLLEQELGVRLFDRSTKSRGMVPTEAARILYDHYCQYRNLQKEVEAALLCKPTGEDPKQQVIDAKRLFYFSEVFKHSSINAVANRLDMAQAGIGRQIKQLERQFGVRLFERGTNGRGMVPGSHGCGMVSTEAARILYGFYCQCHDLQEKLKATIEEWRSMKRGTIYICAPTLYIDVFVQEILNDFYTEHPNVIVCVEEVNSSPQVTAKVIEDKVHIGIVCHSSPDPDIDCRASVPLPIYLLVGKDHPLAKRRRVTLSEAVSYPLALPPASFGLRQIISLIERSENIQIIPAFVSDSNCALRKFIIVRSGATFMSALAARQEIKSSQLVALEIDHPAFLSHSRLIVRRHRPHSPATNQLIRMLMRKFSIFSQTVMEPSL
jgi:DNA-binding transcriptional LysR family regulator